MRTRWVLVLGSVGAMLPAAPAAAATSTPAAVQPTSVSAESVGPNGEIAFAVLEPDDTYDIYVMSADGSQVANITNTPEASESDPNWSPDGLHIAYNRSEGVVFGEADSDIWVMNGDGTDQTALTANNEVEFQPDWSPDGTQLVFVREVPGVVISTQFDLVVMNADGTGQVNISNSDTLEIDPAWSPDGDRLVFAGVRPSPGEEWYRWELVTADPDGSNETLVTTANNMPDGNSYEDRAPDWSPDGEMIVWMAQYDESCCGDWDIWAMNEDGSGKTNLTDDGDHWMGPGDTSPSWAPDGTVISFSSNRDGDTAVYVVDAPTVLPPPDAAPSARLSTFSASAEPSAAGESSDGARLLASVEASDLDWGAAPVDAAAVRVARRGTGSGRVTSADGGISCGSNCTQLYALGTTVKLRARPAPGSHFVGWRGACTGTAPTCTVSVAEAKSVAASFRAVTTAS
jgi:Tol biopolymer transport system component